MIPALSRLILFTDSQFPSENVSLVSFFCKVIPKNIKELKLFKPSKSHQGDLVRIVYSKFNERLKESSK